MLNLQLVHDPFFLVNCKNLTAQQINVVYLRVLFLVRTMNRELLEVLLMNNTIRRSGKKLIRVHTKFVLLAIL